MHPSYPAPSPRALELETQLTTFMAEEVFPREAAYRRFRETHGPTDNSVPPVIEELKAIAFDRGLWNLFLPSESGLSQLEYASLAELTGWSMELAPGGPELLGAGHRQHGAAAPARHRRAEGPLARAAAGR